MMSYRRYNAVCGLLLWHVVLPLPSPGRGIARIRFVGRGIDNELQPESRRSLVAARSAGAAGVTAGEEGSDARSMSLSF